MNKWNIFRKSVISVCLLFLFLTSYVFAAETTTMLEIVPEVSENEVYVTIKYTSDDMCGGSFNFIYDSTKLELINAEEGESIKGITHFINSKFADGVIRANWVSTTEMPTEGILIHIKFDMLDGTFKESDVGIEKLKIADGNGNKQEADYIIVYEDSEQLNPPTEGESEDNPSTEAPEDNAGVNQENVSNNNNSSGSNSSSILKPSSGSSAVKQETEVNTTESTIEFTDVKSNDWFYENVKYVVENKLMNGVSEDEFAPNNTLTRAMLVTVLYRNAGEPAVNKSIPFADVNMGAWYADAVIWAKQNGIVNGVNATDFAPDNNITREQIAAIMHRYAQYRSYAVSVGENTNILSYDDFGSISEYAISSMQYAVGSGLMKGKTTSTLNPLDNATRAEIATILQRFIESNK